MFGGVSKTVLILVTLPAFIQALPRHPVIVSKFFGLPAKILFDSFIKEDLPKGYQELSAKEKQNILWERCTADDTAGNYPNPLELCLIFIRNMNDTFDHVSDERPWRFTKPIHAKGPVCKAKFVADANTPYTGLYKGCKDLLVRLAPGSEPSKSMLSGISAKFLVDGKPSRNYLSFRRPGTLKNPKDGTETWRVWFTGDQSNTPAPIPKPIRYPLLAKFGTSSNEPNHLAVSHLATIDPQGNEVKDPKFPFEVVMTPNKLLKHIILEKLTSIPTGTKLYDVYAKHKDQDSPMKHIGSIVSTSKLTDSNWGDKRLFFQHERRDADLKKLNMKCPYMPARDQFEGA